MKILVILLVELASVKCQPYLRTSDPQMCPAWLTDSIAAATSLQRESPSTVDSFMTGRTKQEWYVAVPEFASQVQLMTHDLSGAFSDIYSFTDANTADALDRQLDTNYRHLKLAEHFKPC